MKNSKLLKAEKMLKEAQEAVTLRDCHDRAVGRILVQPQQTPNGIESVLILSLNTDTITLETLERWIKQAKAARQRGLV